MYVKCVSFGVFNSRRPEVEVLCFYLSWICTGCHFVVDLFLYWCLYDNSESTAHSSGNISPYSGCHSHGEMAPQIFPHILCKI